MAPDSSSSASSAAVGVLHDQAQAQASTSSAATKDASPSTSSSSSSSIRTGASASGDHVTLQPSSSSSPTSPPTGNKGLPPLPPLSNSEEADLPPSILLRRSASIKGKEKAVEHVSSPTQQQQEEDPRSRHSSYASASELIDSRPSSKFVVQGGASQALHRNRSGFGRRQALDSDLRRQRRGRAGGGQEAVLVEGGSSLLSAAALATAEEEAEVEAALIESFERPSRKKRDPRRTSSVPASVGRSPSSFAALEQELGSIYAPHDTSMQLTPDLSDLMAQSPPQPHFAELRTAFRKTAGSSTSPDSTARRFPQRPPLLRSGIVSGTSSALGLSVHGWGSESSALAAPFEEPTLLLGAVAIERASSEGSDQSGKTLASFSTSAATTSSALSIIGTPTTSIAGSSPTSPRMNVTFELHMSNKGKAVALPPPLNIPSAIATSISSSTHEASRHSPPTVVLLHKQVQQRLQLYRALCELVETERTYADDLAILVMVFFENLQRMPFFGSTGDQAEQTWKLDVVTRNAEELLRLHQQVAVRLETIVAKNGLLLGANGGGAAGAKGPLASDPHAATQEEVEKAMSGQLDVAVVDVARYFVSLAPMLAIYETYCSKHSEALGVIHEAERRQSDWQSYEMHCTDILRWQMQAKAKRLSRSPQRSPSATEHTATPFSPTDSESSSRSAGASQLLLHFHDFFVKPVQRIVLYRLVLSTLVKHASGMDDLKIELHEALEAVKTAAEKVDNAGKQREQELMAEMLICRFTLHNAISMKFLRSLGSVILAGPLQTLHYHAQLAPLEAPLRFKYFGLVLFKGWLLFAKVRKSGNYEAKHFFPLSSARLTLVDDEDAAMPHSFRISVRGHHFELAAVNVKEKELWTSSLASAIESASPTPSFPTSLAPEEATISDGSDCLGILTTSTSDPLRAFLASASIVADPPVPAPANNSSATRASRPPLATSLSSASGTSIPVQTTEMFIRTCTAVQRAALDRSMLVSAHCLSVRAMNGPTRDLSSAGSSTSQWLAAPTPTLGATVGAAIGLSRLANGSSAGNVRLQRRKSMIEMTAPLPSPRMRLLDIPSRSSTLLAPGEYDERGNSEGWKNTIRKRVSRSRPASVYAPDTPSDGAPSMPVSVLSTPTMESSEFSPIPESEASEKVSIAVVREENFKEAGQTLQRASSRSFATVRSVFSTGSSTGRVRASTLVSTTEASAVTSALPASQSLELTIKSMIAKGAATPTEFGSVETSTPESAQRASEDATVTARSRKGTLKRALSFRRSSSSSSASSRTDTSASPEKGFTDTIRSIRMRASRHFQRVDMAVSQSNMSNSAESTPPASANGSTTSLCSVQALPSQSMERASTTGATASSLAEPSFQRKRLNRLFVQSHRLSPMPTAQGAL